METAIIVVGVSAFVGLITYSLYLIKEEFLERKLYNLLENKLDIEEYLRIVSNLLLKTKNERKIVKYNLYKTTALYYKGEKEAAVDCLNKIKERLEQLTDKTEIKKIYVVTLFRIMLDMPYTSQMDDIMNENRIILDEMLKMRDYQFNAKMIYALYKQKQGNLLEAKDEMKKLKNTNLSRINRLLIRYYLAVVYVELDKLEEAEIEIEEIQEIRKKTKRQLFIYKEIDNMIKARRSSMVGMSGIDKDKEVGQRQEALDKVNKEIEEEMKKLKNEVTEKLSEEAKVAGTDIELMK